MAGLADKPQSYFIVPVEGATGEGNVLRVSGELAPYPGSVVPQAGNRGRLLPLQAGDLDEDTQPRRVYVLESGGADGGTGTVRRIANWAWRFEEDTDWKGVDDPRYFTGYHAPTNDTTPGSDNCAIGYSSAYRRLIYVAVDDSVVPSRVYAWARGVDADYTHAGGSSSNWTGPETFDLRTALETGNAAEEIAPDKCGARVGELEDGTLVLVLRIVGYRDFSLAYDFNVYHSTDGGKSWTLVADNILRPIGTPADWDSSQGTNIQFSLAVSGSWLRLTWRVDGAGLELYDAVSSDRGMTWQAVPDATPPTTFSNGDPSTPSAFHTTASDGRGGWWGVIQIAADQFGMYYARQDDPWDSVILGVVTLPANLAGLLTVRALGWFWIFAQYQGGGATDGWILMRSPIGVLDDIATGWQTCSPSIDHNASTYVCARPDIAWAGDRFAFVTANKGQATGVEIDLPSYWEGTRGWNERSLGVVPFDADLDVDTLVGGTTGGPYGTYLPLWWNHWNARQGQPWAGAGSLYTQVTAGVFSDVLNMNGLTLSTTGAGSLNFVQIQELTEPWGGDNFGQPRFFGSAFEFVCQIFEGTPGTREAGIGIRLPHGSPLSGQYGQIRLWLYGDTLEVEDVLAATTITTINAPGIGTAQSDLWRIRVSVMIGGTASVQVAAHAESDQDGPWYQGYGYMTTNVAAVQNRLRWGIIGTRTTAGVLSMRFREASVNNRDCLRQSGSNNNTGNVPFPGSPGFNNPLGLLGGAALEGQAIEVGDGLSVTMTGAGGAVGDVFQLEVGHTYAAEHVLVDSPRIQWRVAAPSNVLTSPDEYAGTEWTKNIGTGVNTVADNTRTDPFGVANNASQVTYTRPAGGVVTFLRADGDDQTPQARMALSPNRRGWTFTLWVQNNSGFDLTFGMRVSNSANSTTQVSVNGGGWQRLKFNVSANGTLAAPYGTLEIILVGYTGGTLVDVDLYGAKLTADPELILRYSQDVVDTGPEQLIQATDIAVFECNSRRLLIDTSDVESFQTPTTAQLLDLARYGTDDTALTSSGGAGLGVQFTPPPANILDRQLAGQYLYGEDGGAMLQAIRVSRYVDRGTNSIAYFDQLDGVDASSWWNGSNATTELAVYGTSGATSLGAQLNQFVRVRIGEQEPPTGEDFRIGSIILGMRKAFKVPLEWAFTDNEQPNITSYRTRSAVSWAYREGPPQRTLTSRFVGDWDDRWREEIRYMQRVLSYEVRPLALVLDEEQPNEQVILGRITSGNQQDNAMWWLDDAYPSTPASIGVARTAGDLSFTFTEEV